MMKLINGFLVVVFLTFSIACGNSEQAEESNPTTEDVQVAAVTPNATATLDVEGMTCEMGCKAAIEKHLSKTAGVAECNVDFEKSLAVVAYDNNVITEDQIIAEIGSIANEAYSAKPHVEVNEMAE